MKEKFILQDNQYKLPYHYTFRNLKNRFYRYFGMDWSIEYYSYNSWVLKKLEFLNFKDVVEIGCGDGYLISEVSKLFKNSNCTGYDLSKRSIDLAKIFGDKDVEFFNDDLNKINDNSYDLVLCSQVLEHIPDDEIDGFLDNLFRIVKPKKYLAIVVPGIGKKLIKKHYRHYTTKTLSSYFDEEKFNIITLDTIFHVDIFYKIFIKLFSNKFFKIDVPLLNKFFVNRMKKKNNLAKENYYNVGIILEKK